MKLNDLFYYKMFRAYVHNLYWGTINKIKLYCLYGAVAAAGEEVKGSFNVQEW